MAAVVKCKDLRNTKDIQQASPARSTLMVNCNQSARKGYVFPLAQKEHLSTSTETSANYSSEIEIKSSTPKTIMEQDKNFRAHEKRREGRSGGKVSLKDLEAQQSHSDEEVIGIITLEDVMEALLQEKILDETDACVDVHNKPKIKPVYPRSSDVPRSRRAASFSNVISEQYPSSALRGSTLTSSRGKSLPSSPIAPTSPARSLRTSRRHRLSRVSHESLQLPSDVP